MRVTSKKQKTKSEFKLYDELFCLSILIFCGLFAYEMLVATGVIR